MSVSKERDRSENSYDCEDIDRMGLVKEADCDVR